MEKIPAMTDFRARGTIMGPTGLTAVFGMGTGVAPPVWSPESRPRGGQTPRTQSRCLVLVTWQAESSNVCRVVGTNFNVPHVVGNLGPSGQEMATAFFFGKHGFHDTHRTVGVREVRTTGRGGQAIGCWDWSAATIARRTLPAHRPGRLPGAFIACANGNLVLEGASRLDAFSAYPVPTWLPGDAPSGTAGTPEVGPPQSSRTRGDPSQVSYAHGR